jgi:hypothetical protein
MSSSTDVTPEQQKQNVEKVEVGVASNDAVKLEDSSTEKQKVLAPIPSVNVWQVRKSSSSPNNEEAATNTTEQSVQPQEGNIIIHFVCVREKQTSCGATHKWSKPFLKAMCYMLMQCSLILRPLLLAHLPFLFLLEATSKKSKKPKKSSDLPSLQDSTSWPVPSEAKELPVETSEKKEKRPPRGMQI